MTQSQLPKSFHLRSPEQLEIRSGGGILSLFGMPFLAAGVILWLGVVGVVPFEGGTSQPWWTAPLLFLMGSAFAAVGGGLVFGRSWLIFDRRRGTVLKLRGLLIPMQKVEYDLKHYDRVSLNFTSGDSDSSDTYPVSLEGAPGKSLQISASNDYAVAYSHAVRTAEFLRLPLEEASSDRVQRLDVSDWKANLRDRLRSEEPRQSHPGRPLTVRTQVERTGSELRLTVPAKPVTWLRYLFTLAPAALALYIAPTVKEFLDQTKTPPGIQFWFFGFVLLLFVAGPIAAALMATLKARRGFQRLTLSSRDITLTEHGVFRTSTTTYSVDELVDIDCQTLGGRRRAATNAAMTRAARSYQQSEMTATMVEKADRLVSWAAQHIPSDGIIIKTSRGIVSFGAGLPNDEVAYLLETVREWFRRSW